MKRNALRPVLTVGFMAVIGIALLAGCEDKSDKNSPSVDLTGTWNASDGQVLTLSQSESDVTGSSSGGASIIGSVNEDAFILRFTYPDGLQVQASGTMSGNQLSGSFIDSNGLTGSWSAVLQSPPSNDTNDTNDTSNATSNATASVVGSWAAVNTSTNGPTGPLTMTFEADGSMCFIAAETACGSYSTSGNEVSADVTASSGTTFSLFGSWTANSMSGTLTVSGEPYNFSATRQ